MKIHGEAELRAEWQWRTAAGTPDLAGERRNRTRGWMEKVEGEVTRLGARGNRAERRRTAGTVAGGGSARLGSSRARGRRRGSGEIRVGHWNIIEAIGGGADVGTATRGGSDVEAGGRLQNGLGTASL